MVATSRTFEFLFDASTARMATGLQAGKHGLDELTEEANKADLALRAIPDKVDVGFGISEGSAAKLRAGLLAEKAKIEASLTDIDVDVDTKKATLELARLDARLKKLDRLDVRPEVHVDVDRGVAGAVIAMEGIAGGMRSIGSAGPIAAAGIVAVAAAAGLAIAPAALGGLSAALVGGGAYSLLSAYDELEKGNKKFAVVFGSQADEVDKWARTISERVGVGVEDLKGMASGIQDLLVPVGFKRSDAAELTKEIYGMAAALGEFNNRDTQEAVDAITKGITGERESLKSFSVVLTEAQVQARVETLKGTAAVKGMDDQQVKALATIQLIREASKDAMASYDDGINDAGRSLNRLTAKFATARDDIILGLGQIAVGIMNDLDFGGMADGLDDIPQWIEENKGMIRDFFLSLVSMSLDGADAFLSLGGALIEMAVASGPMVSALSTAVGFASANVLRLAAGAAALSGQHSVAASLLGAANSAQELAGSADRAYQALLEGAPAAIAGIEATRDGLRGVKDSVEELRARDELVVEVRMKANAGDMDAVERELDKMSEKELTAVIRAIPKGTEGVEKELRKTARERRAVIRAESASIGYVDGQFAKLTKKQRKALIEAKKDQSSFDSVKWALAGLTADETKWIEVRYKYPLGTGDEHREPQTQSLAPGAGGEVPTQYGGNTTVVLDGREVASIIATRTNQQHREVYV